MVSVVKNLPADAGDVRDTGSGPGSGRSPGGEHGSPLQYSCLENPVDTGAWWATVRRVVKSQTQVKRLSTRARYTMSRLHYLQDDLWQDGKQKFASRHASSWFHF